MKSITKLLNIPYARGKNSALVLLRSHLINNQRIRPLTRERYEQAIIKFFTEIEKHPNKVKESDVQEYLNNYRIGK